MNHESKGKSVSNPELEKLTMEDLLRRWVKNEEEGAEIMALLSYRDEYFRGLNKMIEEIRQKAANLLPEERDEFIKEKVACIVKSAAEEKPEE